MYNLLVHFYWTRHWGIGHLWADWGTQLVYILIFNNYFFVITHSHTRAHVRTHKGDENRNRELHEVCVSYCCNDHNFRITHFAISAQRKLEQKRIRIFFIRTSYTRIDNKSYTCIWHVYTINYDDCSTRIYMGLNKYMRILKSILTRM